MEKRPSRVQLAQQLQTIPLFGMLDEATIQLLAEQAIWQTVTTGEALFWEGEEATGLYLLQFGWLKVIKSAVSGREQVIKFLAAGETFNEIGALANQPNPATAIALEPSGVWTIPRPVLLRLLRERPLFAQHLIEKLAERVMHLISLVADLSLRSVTGRLARLLLEETTDDVLHRPRWFTQAELAARLGTVPDVVQRALRQLENDNLILVERHRIRLLDRPTLEKLATG